ncbi:hypothetical protein CJ030_MR3G009490 [Morella rubra]|uniref:Uncharacterized protein n=1 Tax=Morella rubra TaxID=262757 RepID=A0A6A1W832_9ROSI|nr:hypothetical protein CJ030_MR3G009490 [Morella rubra]
MAGRWADFEWFSESGFGFEEMFEFQGWGMLVKLKVDCYVYLVELVYANFQYSKSEDATSYVNGKQLDMSVTTLISLVSAPNGGNKFFVAYGWTGMSEVETLDILRVVLDNPALNEIVRPTAIELMGHRRLLHHMVCNIILPRTGKFEYIIFLEIFVMYNKKTLRLMGFMQYEDGEWVKKGVLTPQRGSESGSGYEEESEDEEEADTERAPSGTRTLMGEHSYLFSFSPDWLILKKTYCSFS